MRKSIIALACMCPLAVGAAGFNDSRTVVVHAASYHFNTDSDYRVGGRPLNESNPGIGYRHGFGSFFLHAGAYKNSQSHTSYYAGIGTSLISIGPVSFGVVGGAISGYADRVYPIVLPEMALTYGRASVLMNYAPKAVISGKQNPSVLSLSFGIGF